eukprot:Blabericola_migrator_1__13226@NODE_917_length_6065_cov_346_982161_g638_i0_p2_GENE_NODE_917_length_6065_cov_346_982161_g638_i0NODE_917_length_6065_cov_346_982161_g638_i0_p2_ORF_typecomplete_len431_score66_70PRCC/PF10253_9/3_6Mucin15/PF15672_5/3_7_NODE_917_length_6065_cov_346_982161_g638_i020203312
MRYLWFVALSRSLVSAWYTKCHDADILFVQDLQEDNYYSLEVMKEEVKCLMEEFAHIYDGARFGLMSVYERRGLACLEVSHPLTRHQEHVENAYQTLIANHEASREGKGGALAGLVGAMTWQKALDWKAENRVIVLITNSAPLPNRLSNFWEWISNSRQCRYTTDHAWLPLWALAQGYHIMNFIPAKNPSNEAVSYWLDFQQALPQPSSWIVPVNHHVAHSVAEQADVIRSLMPKKCKWHEWSFSSDSSSDDRGTCRRKTTTTTRAMTTFVTQGVTATGIELETTEGVLTQSTTVPAVPSEAPVVTGTPSVTEIVPEAPTTTSEALKTTTESPTTTAASTTTTEDYTTQPVTNTAEDSTTAPSTTEPLVPTTFSSHEAQQPMWTAEDKVAEAEDDVYKLIETLLNPTTEEVEAIVAAVARDRRASRPLLP